MPPSSDDPELRLLYGNLPEEQWLQEVWLGKLKEVINDQRKTLAGIGQWMKANGEAIYGTRPWLTYGEGPTREPSGGFKDHQKFLSLKYSSQDWRFTRSKDGKTIYAISLGTPAVGEQLTLTSFAPGGEWLEEPLAVQAVQLVGSGAAVEWDNTPKGFVLTMPDGVDDSAATAFKIESK